nr:protoporphyrinogen oxidase-like [Procambarus clarkii]XP_045621261.1 protoporphyrinogen oxidase-like [Procambarus clarkii]XP_045621272.1 protoporphyrinogen oxidase-like [Procambarus clarkii]XP_045621280.1 protoporphyrinogen oxidase-like [Procambarus clarkii]XP_045621285.1 protoporphyrinogen oxidase-like [Procambarus clarkii]XP_045621293.1 protoporphyrinogen oxidase-like [Procambarus clarkii]XP_045621300.1 protoporphyrinogen oxidase-like [Procambarus clarkii]
MIAVVGGGISGLAAAHYLKTLASSSKILVFEASSRLGGWINSVEQDGAVYELGPRTIRVAGNPGANTLALAESLGLTDKIISINYSHASTKNRMILVDGKLHTLPSNLKTLFAKSSPFSRPLALSALKDLFAKKVINNDESLFSFVNRRFDLEVANYAIDPLTRGVFAGSARDLSVTSLAKRMHDVEQRHGSVLMGLLKDRKNAEKPDPLLAKCELVKQARKEKWAVWTLSGGLETFVKVLQEKLTQDGVELKNNTPVNGIQKSGNKLVIQTDKEEIEVNKVVSCLPSRNLSSVVKSMSPELSSLLGFIPYATVGVVNLEYQGQVLHEPAFGYLVPSSQANKVLGVIFDTCTFPQGDRTILTVMMGGYWFESLFGDSPSYDELLDVAISEVKATLNIKMEPVHYKVSILRDCIPQYIVGHSETVHNIRKLIHDLKIPLNLAGNSYDGIGVNDAIMSAKKAAL